MRGVEREEEVEEEEEEEEEEMERVPFAGSAVTHDAKDRVSALFWRWGGGGGGRRP